MVPHDSHPRRRFLGALAASVGLAGCTADQESNRTTTSPARTSSRTATSTSDVTTTRQATTTAGVSHRYEFGEWHLGSTSEVTYWRFTVAGIELADSFTVQDFGKEYWMPDGKRLAILTTKVTNETDSYDTWEHDERFVVILSDGTVAKPQSSLAHPDLASPVSIQKLERITSAEQYSPQGFPVPVGETRTLQWVVVVPQVVSNQSLQVGFDPGGQPTTYSVRWTSAGQSQSFSLTEAKGVPSLLQT